MFILGILFLIVSSSFAKEPVTPFLIGVKTHPDVPSIQSLKNVNIREVKVSYKLCQLAYLNRKLENKDLSSLNIKVEHDNYAKNKTSRYIIAGNKEELYIAYRGTTNESEIFIDFIKPKVPFFNHGKVHSRFLENTQSTYKEVLHFLQKKRMNRKVIITGHSLGGVEATLTVALGLIDNVYYDTLCTFESPRIGNQRFVYFFKDNFKGTFYPIIESSDIVPLLPLKFSGYRHVYSHFLKRKGSKISIGNTGFFDGELLRELWYGLKRIFSKESIKDAILKNHRINDLGFYDTVKGLEKFKKKYQKKNIQD